MLNDFIDEVTSQGAEAVLPQNLDDEWLDDLYAAAVDFLRAVTAEETVAEAEEEMFDDEESMVLLTAVAEILQYQRDYHPEILIPEGELFEPLSCYALWVVYEYLARKVQMEIDPPTLETVFDRDRVMAVEEHNPEVTAALHMLVGGGEAEDDGEEPPR